MPAGLAAGFDVSLLAAVVEGGQAKARQLVVWALVDHAFAQTELWHSCSSQGSFHLACSLAHHH